MVHASGFIEPAAKPKKTHAPKPRKNRERNRLQIAAEILESIDDYISAFDRNWNIIYLNKTTAKDFGFKPEELIGKNFWKTFPRFVGTEVEKNYRETMTKREVKCFEWKTIYANTGYREFKVFPSVEGITVYGVDITQRKQLQQQLEEYTKNLEKKVEQRTKKIRESEQSYRELYESFGEGFIAMDWELTVLHWNRAAERVTKIKAQEAIGKKIYEVLPEMMSVDVTPYFEALQKKKPARFMMKTVSRETGHPALFEVSSYPSESGVIIIVEDKTLEEETKRLLTIGQTAGMVGHDIRNPLQSIVSSMYLIKTDLDSLADSPEKINALQEFDSIFDQISYVDKIVSDLQDFARPIRPELREVDAKTLVASTLAALNVPSNIEVKYSDESLPRLKTDPVLLKRILLNLATNAIQAMPNGGKLTIRLRREKKAQGITLVVTDTGGGIPKDVQGKLFTPLFTTKSKGQGFGLAVVKRLVEAQGGAISFRTQAGKGTTFTVKLPSQKYTTYKLIQSSQTPI